MMPEEAGARTTVAAVFRGKREHEEQREKETTKNTMQTTNKQV